MELLSTIRFRIGKFPVVSLVRLAPHSKFKAFCLGRMDSWTFRSERPQVPADGSLGSDANGERIHSHILEFRNDLFFVPDAYSR